MAKKTSAISLRYLSEKTGIEYMKIRNNIIAGKYKSLTPQEKTEIVNALYDDANPLIEKLGFFMTIHRLKGQDQQDQKKSR